MCNLNGIKCMKSNGRVSLTSHRNSLTTRDSIGCLGLASFYFRKRSIQSDVRITFSPTKESLILGFMLMFRLLLGELRRRSST